MRTVTTVANVTGKASLRGQSMGAYLTLVRTPSVLDRRLAFTAVWEYCVPPEHVREFEALYGPEGAWARLFGRDPAYLGTELLVDAEEPYRYLTIDRWRSRADFEAFREHWCAEYEALDLRCAALGMCEERVGSFVPA